MSILMRAFVKIARSFLKNFGPAIGQEYILPILQRMYPAPSPIPALFMAQLWPWVYNQQYDSISLIAALDANGLETSMIYDALTNAGIAKIEQPFMRSKITKASDVYLRRILQQPVPRKPDSMISPHAPIPTPGVAPAVPRVTQAEEIQALNRADKI